MQLVGDNLGCEKRLMVIEHRPHLAALSVRVSHFYLRLSTSIFSSKTLSSTLHPSLLRPSHTIQANILVYLPRTYTTKSSQCGHSRAGKSQRKCAVGIDHLDPNALLLAQRPHPEAPSNPVASPPPNTPSTPIELSDNDEEAPPNTGGPPDSPDPTGPNIFEPVPGDTYAFGLPRWKRSSDGPLRRIRTFTWSSWTFQLGSTWSGRKISKDYWDLDPRGVPMEALGRK